MYIFPNEGVEDSRNNHYSEATKEGDTDIVEHQVNCDSQLKWDQKSYIQVECNELESACIDLHEVDNFTASVVHVAQKGSSQTFAE